MSDEIAQQFKLVIDDAIRFSDHAMYYQAQTSNTELSTGKGIVKKLGPAPVSGKAS